MDKEQKNRLFFKDDKARFHKDENKTYLFVYIFWILHLFWRMILKIEGFN